MDERTEKNPAAVKLGQLRWKGVSPEERSEAMRQVRAAHTHRKKLKKKNK